MPSNQSLKGSFLSLIREPIADSLSTSKRNVWLVFCSTFHGYALLLSHLPYINAESGASRSKEKPQYRFFFCSKDRKGSLVVRSWRAVVADGTNTGDSKRRRGGTRCEKWREWVREMHEKMAWKDHPLVSFRHIGEATQTANARRGTLTVTALDLAVFRVAWLINTSFSFNGAGASPQPSKVPFIWVIYGSSSRRTRGTADPVRISVCLSTSGLGKINRAEWEK